MSAFRLVRSAAAAATAIALALVIVSSEIMAGSSQSQATALVTVVSEPGAPITDLTAADFIVREKKTPLDVARVDRLNDVPLYVSVLLDISKPPLGTPPPISDMRAAMSAFVESIRAANPGAQIALTEVSGAAVPSVAFDATPEDLDAAVARLNVGQQVDAVLMEGMADAARALHDKPSIRKAILLIDFGSNEPTRPDTMRTAVEEAQRAQASVWSVSIRGANSSTSRREPPLKAAVDATGGMRLTAVAASGLKSLLQTVANSLSSQYLVAFTRTSTSPVSAADITVETKRKNKVLVASVMR